MRIFARRSRKGEKPGFCKRYWLIRNNLDLETRFFVFIIESETNALSQNFEDVRCEN